MRLDRTAIEAPVQTQVSSWRALLTDRSKPGATLLREVLQAVGVHARGRRAITSAGGWRRASSSQVRSVEMPKVASPPGFEPGFQP